MEELFEKNNNNMSAPVSPSGQYLRSSALSLTVIVVLEFEVTIHDLEIVKLIDDVFLPINPRFSSIMIEDKERVKKWKRVEVDIESHVFTPIFNDGQSLEFYDKCFSDYVSKISMDELPQSRPLWEVHMFAYPTSHAAGNIIFKLHHALGDGYSLMGTLLSCFHRADNPSLPPTFPSREPSNSGDGYYSKILKFVPRFFLAVGYTVLDFGWSVLKSTILEDDRTPIRSGDDGVEFRPISVTTLTFHIDQIKQIKAKVKVTVNDVMAGIVMLGIRLYMEEASPNSGKAKTTALVLHNTRAKGGYRSVSEMIKPNAEMPWGNRFAFLPVSIPKLTASASAAAAAATNSSDPLNFVLQVHRTIKRKKSSAAVYLTAWLLDILRRFKGPEATARCIHSTLKNSSVGMSNMIGPVETLALANHPIRGLYFTVVGPPQSLAILMVSYMGQLKLCVSVEKGFIDAEKLKQCIQNSFEIMLKAAIQTYPPPKSKYA